MLAEEWNPFELFSPKQRVKMELLNQPTALAPFPEITIIKDDTPKQLECLIESTFEDQSVIRKRAWTTFTAYCLTAE